MRLALVGPGAMGAEHAKAFLGTGKVTLQTVIGIDPIATERFATSYGFRRSTTDFQDGIDEVDVVIVASPTPMHVMHTIEAVSAGKHVLVEIPIATSLADAVAVASAAKGSQGVVMAGHISRYYPAIRSLIARAQSGRLSPHHIACLMGTDKRHNRNWLGQERDWIDDLLWHHGMHVFDTVLQLVPSTVTSAHAVAGQTHPDHGGLMDVSSTLRFANGTVATIALTYHGQQQITRYTVVAEEGFFDYTQDLPGGERTDLTEGQPFSNLVTAQALEFLAACEGRAGNPISVDDILPAIRLVDSLARQLPA